MVAKTRKRYYPTANQNIFKKDDPYSLSPTGTGMGPEEETEDWSSLAPPTSAEMQQAAGLDYSSKNLIGALGVTPEQTEQAVQKEKGFLGKVSELAQHGAEAVMLMGMGSRTLPEETKKVFSEAGGEIKRGVQGILTGSPVQAAPPGHTAKIEQITDSQVQAKREQETTTRNDVKKTIINESGDTITKLAAPANRRAAAAHGVLKTELTQENNKKAQTVETDIRNNPGEVSNVIPFDSNSLAEIDRRFQENTNRYLSEIEELERNPIKRRQLFSSDRPMASMGAAIGMLMGAVGGSMQGKTDGGQVVFDNIMTLLDKEYEENYIQRRDEKETLLQRVKAGQQHQAQQISTYRAMIAEASAKSTEQYQKDALAQQNELAAERQAQAENSMNSANAKLEIQIQRRGEEISSRHVSGYGSYDSQKDADNATAFDIEHGNMSAAVKELQDIVKSRGKYDSITNDAERRLAYSEARTRIQQLVAIIKIEYKGENWANLGAAFTETERAEFLDPILSTDSFAQHVTGKFEDKINGFADMLEVKKGNVKAKANRLDVSQYRYLTAAQKERIMLGKDQSALMPGTVAMYMAERGWSPEDYKKAYLARNKQAPLSFQKLKTGL